MPLKSRKMSMIILIITALSTALITGLWYAYSWSVNPGLGKLGDKEYLLAMQSINREILNPVFFASFMGTLILLPLATWLHYTQPASSRFVLLLIASVLYLGGVFIVTVAGNVPLNNALDTFNIQAATPEAIAKQRLAFEAPWNRLHGIRGIASFIALVLVIMACIDVKRVRL